MLRVTSLAALAALALVACSGQKKPGVAASSSKSGPAVAKGSGIVITADEFKARLDEQSPFIRARYTTLERKKEFLDNLVRFEVLAKAAADQGLDQDPDVQQTLKKVMVQKLVQKTFQDTEGAKNVPEAELTSYYEQHKDEYVKPARVRLSQIAFKAPKDAPAAARKAAAEKAKKALARVQDEEKKNPGAFPLIAREVSEDEVSKPMGGDLGLKSKAELEALSPRLAEAAQHLADGQVSPVVETEQGYVILKKMGTQEEINRSFDSVRAQIANKLYREQKTKDFDAYVKKLKDDAKISVDDAELEKIAVAAPPAPTAGAPVGAAVQPAAAPHGAQPVAVPPAQK
jgi:peptidyl-prolyl cis-trans isomerase C